MSILIFYCSLTRRITNFPFYSLKLDFPELIEIYHVYPNNTIILMWHILMQVNTQAPSSITDCSNRDMSKYYVVVVQVWQLSSYVYDQSFCGICYLISIKSIAFRCSILLDSMPRLWRTFYTLLTMERYPRRNSIVSLNV